MELVREIKQVDKICCCVQQKLFKENIVHFQHHANPLRSTLKNKRQAGPIKAKNPYDKLAQQPWLKTVYEEPSIISCRQEITLKGIHYSQNLKKSLKKTHGGHDLRLVNPIETLVFQQKTFTLNHCFILKFDQNTIIITTRCFKLSHEAFWLDKKGIYCAVPENIHTTPTEGIGISWGVGGSARPKNLMKCMKLNWNFQGGCPGGLRKKSLPWERYGYFLESHILTNKRKHTLKSAQFFHTKKFHEVKWNV